MTAPLAGKVAVVTGAGRMRGIGRAIALRLAHDGADLVVSTVARPLDAMPAPEQEAAWRADRRRRD
jgi:3-oxoacyl-[acyl-carrier protein] reductase